MLLTLGSLLQIKPILTQGPFLSFTVSPKYIENLRFPGFPINFPLKRPFGDSYNPFYLFLESLKSRSTTETTGTPYLLVIYFQRGECGLSTLGIPYTSLLLRDPVFLHFPISSLKKRPVSKVVVKAFKTTCPF